MGRSKILNIGCGFKKILSTDDCEAVNMDAYDICNPDVVWNIEQIPWPFDALSFDMVTAFHVFEHLLDWWPAFEECSRVLKIGGTLEIRVPDESASTALTFRDHYHVFSRNSFHGADRKAFRSATNAWAKTVEGTVPLRLNQYQQVPYPEYMWMMQWPMRYVLAWCAKHLRNFIWEQRFMFLKTEKGRNDEIRGDDVLPLRIVQRGC